MIRMSLGLPLMMLAAGAHAQLSPAAPGVSIETMDLGSIMALVRQQRSALQNADPGVQPQPQQQTQQQTQQLTKQEQQQLTKQEQERKEQLQQLEQKIKRQEQVKQEPATKEQATQEQQAKQQTKQQQTSKEQALKEQQQLANQEQQAKQEQQTKTGQQPQTKQEQKTTSQPARQQLLALLGSGNDKPAPVPTTTGDVTTYLASGQGNRDAQSQILAPVVPVAPVGSAAGAGSGAPVGSIPPDVPVAGGATTAGIGGLSAGGAVASTLATALAAAAASSGDGGAAVLSALQQQQQQSAATAAQQQAYSYVTANMVTPLASFPTTLRATYSGPVTGTASAGAGVTGTFQALVDFATIRGGAPSVPGSITFSNGLGGTTFTLTLLGGFVGGSMSGTYAGQAVTGFVMNGRFYGPAAEQLAGSWSMQNAGATLTGSGSFKAQR